MHEVCWLSISEENNGLQYHDVDMLGFVGVSFNRVPQKVIQWTKIWAIRKSKFLAPEFLLLIYMAQDAFGLLFSLIH